MLAKSSPTHDHRHQIHYTPQRQKRKSALQQSLPTESGLQWGSDPSFCYHGFSSPIGTWTEERLLRDLMRNMAFMWCGKNVDYHQYYNDPSRVADKPLATRDEVSIKASEQSFLDFGESQMDMAFTSKSLSPTTSVEDNENYDMAPPNKKRKCLQRPGQALCHCRSEKKRREAVSQGYHDLSRLVPGLESQNFTRKHILDEAAKYLEDLLQGNDSLRQKIATLDENTDSLDIFVKEEIP